MSKMKILVPSDFSKFADNAFDMAIKMSTNQDDKIVVFHNVDVPDFWNNIETSGTAQQYFLDYKEGPVKAKLEAYNQKCISANIQFESIITGGNMFNNLTKTNESGNYDCLVMGSHGASGAEEWFVGSRTQKAIRKIHNNILVVKNKVDRLDFSKVVYVTGLNQNEKESFKTFMDIISVYEVKELHILSIDTSSFYTQPRLLMLEALKDYEHIATNFDVQTHFYSDYSIDAGVRHFVEEKGISLIGISNHHRHPIKRIFLGSNVEIICNHSNVPVLSIDYK